MSFDAARLVDELRSRAKKLGFDAFGITSATARPDLAGKLRIALERGWHADMDWMAETEERRVSPRALWQDVRSVIMVGINYGPSSDPMDRLKDKSLANVSAYAQMRDYHDVVKGKIKDLAGLLARRAGAEVKVFVDTAPVMEKPFAETAGLGWQGKHTVLVSRDFGSWLFLGSIYTNAQLPVEAAHKESCGRCTRCLDVCPTDAFPAPFQLDARKCLAYYSVEHKGQIPLALREPMGNRVFGCDDCLAVCPWNKFASEARELKLQSRHEIAELSLSALLALDDPKFRDLFSGTPVKRLGWDRMMRNGLVAVGNSGDSTHLPRVREFLAHPDPRIRGMAIWALKKLAPQEANARSASAQALEGDDEVRAEWLN